MAMQQRLLDVGLTEPTTAQEGANAPPPAPRLKTPNRDQYIFGAMDLEKLIPSDHLARAISELAGRLGMAEFLKENKSVVGHAGRPRTCPQMLLAIWVYSYSQGMGQAEEIADEMKWEPGLRWLAGNGTLSARTLSEFRVAHGEALRQAFAEMLGILAEAGLIDLTQVTLDGTKVKASASSGSLRREKTLREHIAEAAEVVAELAQEERAEEISVRQKAARQRAATERQARLTAGLEELEKLRAGQDAAAQEQARVSLTDPAARVMKDGHGGFAPSYNVQITTDVKHKIIVDITACQDAADYDQLVPALDRLEQQHGKLPEQVMVDGGYAKAANVTATATRGVELVGPIVDRAQQQASNTARSLKAAGIAAEFGPSAFRVIHGALQCPAGQPMRRSSETAEYTQYMAEPGVCAACPHQSQCCPRSGRRSVKVAKPNAVVAAYVQRMQTEESQALYRRRGEVAEFPHAWIKDKFGLRQFHVRGLAKVTLEAIWVALTYDIQQWARLIWRPKLAQA